MIKVAYYITKLELNSSITRVACSQNAHSEPMVTLEIPTDAYKAESKRGKLSLGSRVLIAISEIAEDESVAGLVTLP